MSLGSPVLLTLLFGTLGGPALAAEPEPPPDLLLPLKTDTDRPADVALVVGVQDYAFVPDVPFASRDARAFYTFLVHTRGLSPENVVLLDAGANREMVLQAASTLRSQRQAEGVFWLYFAGHGIAMADGRSRMLLGDDVRHDQASFRTRGVSLEGLVESLAVAGPVVAVLDTCYNGLSRTGDALLPDSRSMVPDHALAAPPGVVLWSATQPSEVAGPLPGVRHGAFTYLAIGALRGWADGAGGDDPDGAVTLAEAGTWVSEAFMALDLGGQHPQMTGRIGQGPMVVGALEPAPSLATLRMAGRVDPEASEPAWARQETLEAVLDYDTQVRSARRPRRFAVVSVVAGGLGAATWAGAAYSRIQWDYWQTDELRWTTNGLWVSSLGLAAMSTTFATAALVARRKARRG